MSRKVVPQGPFGQTKLCFARKSSRRGLLDRQNSPTHRRVLNTCRGEGLPSPPPPFRPGPLDFWTHLLSETLRGFRVFKRDPTAVLMDRAQNHRTCGTVSLFANPDVTFGLGPPARRVSFKARRWYGRRGWLSAFSSPRMASAAAGCQGSCRASLARVC